MQDGRHFYHLGEKPRARSHRKIKTVNVSRGAMMTTDAIFFSLNQLGVPRKGRGRGDWGEERSSQVFPYPSFLSLTPSPVLATTAEITSEVFCLFGNFLSEQESLAK